MNPAKPKIKIGINGFGGIGRLVARAILQRDDMEVVAINDAFFHNEFPNPYHDYGLVHGNGAWKSHHFDVCRHGAVLFGEKRKHVKVYNESDPALIPWAHAGAEYVVETSSEAIDQEKAYAHIKGGGAKKVIITSYSEDFPMFVVGVNVDEYKPELDIVSIGSRTTNCLAPLAKVVHNRFGIIEGIVESHHPFVDQLNSYDFPFSGEQDVTHSNYKAAKAVERVIPALQDKLTGLNFYIPMANVDVVEFLVVLEKATTLEQIKDVIREESQGELNDILGCIENDLISKTFDGDKRSCIFDVNASDSLSDRVVMLTAWYNNEWGYRACCVLFTVLGRARMGDESMLLIFRNLPSTKEYRDVFVYNTAISGLLYCRWYQDAWKLYESMEHDNICPDHVTCSILILH